MPARRLTALAAAAGVALIGGLALGAVRLDHPAGAGTGGGMGGMMGGGAGGRGHGGALVAAGVMTARAAAAARGAHISGSTVSYSSPAVTLVALGAPGNRPGMYWQVDGVDGATVSVPAGASVTVQFADGDPGHSHGFELTAAAPPYPRMVMMSAAPAAGGAFIRPVPPPDGGNWYAASVTFRAPPPGIYYYLCPVPGHAQHGMWGRFVVR